MEPEVADVAAKAAPGVVGTLVAAGLAGIGWLANRVFRSIRHDINDAKQVGVNAAVIAEKKADKSEMDSVWKEIEKRTVVEAKLFDLMREHEEKDSDRFAQQDKDNRDRHDELMAIMGDMRADLAGLKK